MRQFFRAACAAAAVVMLAACGDSTGPWLATDPGSLSFAFRGALQGWFSARGGAGPLSPPTAEYAEALRRPGYLAIEAGNPLPRERMSAVRLTAYFDPAVGAYPVCSPSFPVAGPCLDLRILMTLDTGAGPREYAFVLPASGSVTIEELSRGRVRGTFSARTQDLLTRESIEVTQGRFDVPIRDL